MTTNFMIGPTNEGMRKDVKPFAIPENAFEVLTNAYQFRGRIVRRPGYDLLGRLSNKLPVMGLRTRELFGLNKQALIAFDTTSSYIYDFGSLSFITLQSQMPVIWTGTNSQFFFTTNYAGGFWATNSKPGLNGVIISTITPGAGTSVVTTAVPHGFTNGQYVTFINVGGAGSNSNLNGNTYIISLASGNVFTISVTATGPLSGGIALNNQVQISGQDGIRYYGDLNYDGLSDVHASWANYNPPIDPFNALAGALLIFPYRGYLVFLNTYEGNNPAQLSNYPNRARWTQIGTPYYSLPVPNTPNLQGVDPNAARDDLFGIGGANDAPTSEVIVGAAFIRDILIVYFERSTWRLRFVNNSQNPFVWERINVELGCDSTFSTIPFDKGVMGISNRGIVISDGNDTQRFDEKIPEEIFAIRQANNGLQRVYGIRTFRTKLNYWAVPSVSNPFGIFPDQVLVFNYDTKNWSYFDDCFTCFGYYYPQYIGKKWSDLKQAWSSYNTENSQSGTLQQGYETAVAGNQQGFVFLLEQTNGPNSESLYVQSISGNALVSPDYNLANGTWISLKNMDNVTSSDGVSLNGRNFKIAIPSINANQFILTEFEPFPAGPASGSAFTKEIGFVPIIPGSVQINVGSLQFTDPELDGQLVGSDMTSTGGIDYITGSLSLNFSPPLGSPTNVNIRVVSFSKQQNIVSVPLIGTYLGNGLITKISNIDIQTKIFNFFGEDQRARLSKIDFYTDLTAHGQFTCNIFADSGDIPINTPLSDNLQSNVVLTSPSQYQVPSGEQSIYRLYCDAIAQTLQIQITLSDQQMSVNSVNQEDIELLSMIVSMRKAGRLV